MRARPSTRRARCNRSPLEFTWKKLFSGLSRSDQKKRKKGCDMGYALAARSCEGPDNVDACTVTAFDVNTAFAVPNPNSFLAECVGFFGSECPLNRFTGPITQSTSAQQLFISTEPFDRRRERSYRKSDRCQHPWLVQTTKYFRVKGYSFKPVIMRVLKSH
jgi:hypothetical protein